MACATTYRTTTPQPQHDHHTDGLVGGYPDARAKAYITLLDNVALSTLSAERIQTNQSLWAKLCNVFSAASPPTTYNSISYLTKETLDRLIHWDLVGVQPLTGPTGSAYVLRHEPTQVCNVVRSVIAIKTHNLHTSPRMQLITPSSTNDDGVTALATIASGIANELNRELVTTLCTLAADISLASEPLSSAYVVGTIRSVSDQIGRETKRGHGNFLILGTSLLPHLVNANGYERGSEIDPTADFAKVGRLDDLIDVWACKPHILSTDSTILIGYRGASEFDVGYVYAPWIVVTEPLVSKDNQSSEPRITISTQFGDATSENTAAYYKTINFV